MRSMSAERVSATSWVTSVTIVSFHRALVFSQKIAAVTLSRLSMTVELGPCIFAHRLDTPQTGSSFHEKSHILARTLNAEGITSRGGRPVDKGYLYKLLSNRVYIGEAVHKGTSYPGEHQPIISRDLWDKVRSIVAETPRKRAGHCRGQTPALLRGLIFAPNGYAMTPAHTRKKGKLYRYYVTTTVQKLGPETCPVRRLPAAEIEAAVIDQVRAMLRSPEMIVKTWAAAREADNDISDTEVARRTHSIRCSLG